MRLRELAAVDVGQVAGAMALQRQHERGARVEAVGVAQQAGQGARRRHVLLPARVDLHAPRRAGRDLDQAGVRVDAVDQRNDAHALLGHLEQVLQQGMLGERDAGAVGEGAELVVGAERGVDGEGDAAARGSVGERIGVQAGSGHGFLLGQGQQVGVR